MGVRGDGGADQHLRQDYVSILQSSANTFSEPIFGVHDSRPGGLQSDGVNYSNKYNPYPGHRVVRQRQSGMYPHQQLHHHYGHKDAITLITELGSESNAHGLAKIVTSSDTKRKVIWALMVIIGFTAATLQLSLLVRKYLEFQVVELSEIKDSMPVEFPSVTVCNIEPVSWRKIRVLFSSPEGTDLMKWLAFTDSFKFGKQHPHLTSIRAFYENLGEEAIHMSHDLQDFLVHCQFNKENCYTSNFTTSFDGNYFNCFTFSGGEKSHELLTHATGPQNGLSLIISLDNDEPPLGSYGIYNIRSNILHSAGVRVVVHAPNTMPSPVDHGFDIPPGYSSSIGLKAVLNTRLSEPYGNCTNKKLDQRYTNTFFSCLQVCKQRTIMERCGCKSSALPNIPFPNISFCGVILNWKNILEGHTVYKPNDHVHITTLACEEKVLLELSNDRSYEITCQCYQPCRETTYQKSVSLSYWPLEFYQLHALEVFYGKENLKNQSSFMNEAHTLLEELGDLERLASKRNVSPTDDTQQLLKESYTLSEKDKAERASDLIRQNLLRLNVYLEDLSVVEYRQLPAYGLADLFADIGGTLGLWMGISVLTIMELIELIIRLFFLLFNSETKPPPFPGQEDDEYVASDSMLASHGHNANPNYDQNYDKEYVDASGFEYKMTHETLA